MQRRSRPGLRLTRRLEADRVAKREACASAITPIRVAAYLGGLQEEDDRIDIVRNVWDDQMADRVRLLDAFEHTRQCNDTRQQRVA